jgi:lysyl-tRNA synthetase class 2
VDLELLKERHRIIKGVRDFFDSRGYLEVDTPLLAPHLIPETCLEVFETTYVPPAGSRRAPQTYWLIPSPELWMKRLIAQHRRSIYQICHCFRNGESTGRIHSPEFTMLEFYTIDADYRDSIRITEELFHALLRPEDPSDLRPPFLQISMDEAFRRWAGFSLYQAGKEGPERFRHEAARLGLEPPPELSLADLYNLIFVHVVEPSLPRERPVVLMDYPAFVPCLAKDHPDGQAKERWELYVRGIELANTYTEETNPDQVRAYFEKEGAQKEACALVPHRIDRDYWKIFLPRQTRDGAIQPYPSCSGVALGLDRLIMIFCGHSTIDGVLPFPMEASL